MPETLSVAEAKHRDAGRGIARVDSEVMQKLGLVSGDIIEIKGKEAAYAIVWPGYPEDGGKGLIRIDGSTRSNVGVGIGERVEIEKIEAENAKRIDVAPTQPIRIVRGEEYLRKVLEGQPVVKGQQIRIDILGTPLTFIVTSTQPSGAVIVTSGTEIALSTKPVEALRTYVTYEDIGGLKREIGLIREMIELPLKHPELFEKLGIEPPKGVLLHGPPGTGKTLISKAVANETDANFFFISGPEVIGKYYGESEARLRQIFEQAEASPPAIVLIDELDAIAPKRSEMTGERMVERRVVAQLLALMDGLKARGKLVVIGATNMPNLLDPALRRGGRFDREIEIGIPDRNGRYEILQIHTRGMPLAKDVDLGLLADITHGYVGADVAALCKEAAMHALREIIPKIDIEAEIPTEVLEALEVRSEDFYEALKGVTPSAMREVFIEVPKVKWDDIGGLEQAKQELIEAVEWPLKYPEAFATFKTKPPKGILLLGPPGTGKTMLAKAVATESEANFISIKGPELLSKFVGESLPYDETVMIFNNGMPQKLQIGALVENKPNCSIMVPTITDEYKAKVSEATDFIRHPAPAHINVIRTATGREVKVTDDHSLFIKDGGSLCQVTTDKIMPGKTRIAILRKIRASKTIEGINFIDRLRSHDYGLYVCNGQAYVRDAVMKLGIEEVAAIIGVQPKSVYAYMSRAALRASKFLKLTEKAGLVYSPDKLEITSRRRRTCRVKGYVSLDEKFSMFLGWWIAEGSYSPHGIRLSVSERDAKSVAGLCKDLFGDVKVYHKSGKSADVWVCSIAVRVLLKEILGLKGGAESEHAPDVIFAAPLGSIGAFLRGYFSGDGSFHQHVVETSTVSRKLVDDLMTLLLYFGIVGGCHGKVEKRGRPAYRITISRCDFLEPFMKHIGFADKERDDRLRKYVENAKHRWAGEKRMDGDVYWDLVVEKTQVPYNHPFVYDLSVNPTERFLAGFGNVLVHNSERGVREMFRKGRQASPCIIFFDEIDAMCPTRTVSFDSHVSERVVSQMLTELDGLEELKDVVVVCASNRPDMIDRALLRPGRIDRLIYTPSPDKKAREEIFKIHLKEKPLAPDVDIAALAAGTEGYVGADIAAICREAVMLSLREVVKRGMDKEAVKKALRDKKVEKRHFTDAIKKVKPTMTPELRRQYEQVMAEFAKYTEEKPEREKWYA